MGLTKTIYNALWRRFSPYKGYKYQIENSYVFNWESDFFCMSPSDYFYEIEVKVSRADFFADFNKEEKHKILSSDKPFIHRGLDQYNGYMGLNRKQWFSSQWTGEKTVLRTNIEVIYPNKQRPHKFIYACPEGLIEPNEIPDYAGLMWTRGTDLIYKKKPPFIHKRDIDLNKTLLEKFYWSYVREKEKA